MGQYMPSAIQVNENEKRKHASLTIVGTKYDFALRVGRAERKPLHGGVTWGAKRGGIVQLTPDMPGERTDGKLRNRVIFRPRGYCKKESLS